MSNIFDLFKKIEHPGSQTTVTEPITHILCGLGNPGEKYTYTKHNAGFLCMDYIAGKLNVKITKLKFTALCGEAVIGGKRTLLLKPQTFMNHSGQSVAEAANFYKIPPENILVIYDDISLEPGYMRVRRKGSDGGHNGIKSILYHLGSDNFPRIKIGVGAKPEGWDLADWVLSAISEEKRAMTWQCIENSLPCAELILKGDIDGAMGRYNGSQNGK